MTGEGRSAAGRGHVGIDLGDRRIGVAVVDAPGGRARPYTTLPRADDPAEDARAIGAIAASVGAADLVVGLPLEASGAEGPQARITRDWVERIAPLVGIPVRLRDERLTSHLAEERLGRAKRGRSGGPPSAAQRRARRERIDREAAAIILQDDLDARETDGWR